MKNIQMPVKMAHYIFWLVCASYAQTPESTLHVCVQKYESKDRKVKTIMSLKEFNLMLLYFILANMFTRY